MARSLVESPRMDDRAGYGPQATAAGVPDPERSGPLDHAAAAAMLAQGDRLLAAAEFPAAARYYQRVIGTPDPVQTAAAMFGLGMALFRLDRDDQARGTWEGIL